MELLILCVLASFDRKFSCASYTVNMKTKATPHRQIYLFLFTFFNRISSGQEADLRIIGLFFSDKSDRFCKMVSSSDFMEVLIQCACQFWLKSNKYKHNEENPYFFQVSGNTKWRCRVRSYFSGPGCYHVQVSGNTKWRWRINCMSISEA